MSHLQGNEFQYGWKVLACAKVNSKKQAHQVQEFRCHAPLTIGCCGDNTWSYFFEGKSDLK